jgi:hypothetical protein
VSGGEASDEYQMTCRDLSFVIAITRNFFSFMCVVEFPDATKQKISPSSLKLEASMDAYLRLKEEKQDKIIS